MSNEKKERVIHTRVPESLDDEIKRKASDLGLSVSNLVRNVLQNTFGLIEDIVHDSAEIARFDPRERVTERRRSADSAHAPRVLGWQLAILSVNALCESCNAVLAKGTRAGIGIVDGGGPVPFRCQPCLEELSDGDEPQSRDE